MQLRDFIKSLPDEEARKAFAARCGTSIGHLRNVGYGKSCAPALAVAVERESSSAVKRQELCPANWRAIWPELESA
jgi:DNA-binding transcriptional regulator YdaS (Cro superfamily)